MKKIFCVILFFSVAISLIAHGRQFDIYRKVFPRKDVIICTAGYIGLAAGTFFLIEGIKDWRKMRQAKKSGKKLMLYEEKNGRDAAMLIWFGAISIPVCTLLSSFMTHCLYWSYKLKDNPLISLKGDGLYTHYSGQKARKICATSDVHNIKESVDEHGNTSYIALDHENNILLRVNESDVDKDRMFIKLDNNSDNKSTKNSSDRVVEIKEDSDRLLRR